ncbi:MAG: hypothetical protein MR355_05270 [Lachnospiraceae bacterium]|nr:hypothetical protein [Lachnospiraceae bacterium]
MITTSILTSGSVLALVGFLMSFVSTHAILLQLGLFVERGALLSMTSVFFVLPGLLNIFDGLFQKTTLKVNFYNPGKEKESNEELS